MSFAFAISSTFYNKSDRDCKRFQHGSQSGPCFFVPCMLRGRLILCVPARPAGYARWIGLQFTPCFRMKFALIAVCVDYEGEPGAVHRQTGFGYGVRIPFDWIRSTLIDAIGSSLFTGSVLSKRSVQIAILRKSFCFLFWMFCETNIAEQELDSPDIPRVFD